MRQNKTQYSEVEAAEELGVSVERLRSLIRSHIVDDENTAPVMTFHLSDLLVLRILSTANPLAG